MTSNRPSLPLKPDAFMRVRGNGSPILWCSTLAINVILAFCPLTWIRLCVFPLLRSHATRINRTKLIVDLYVSFMLVLELTVLLKWANPAGHWLPVAVAVFALVDVAGATLRDVVVASSLYHDDRGPFILVQDPIRWLIMMPLAIGQTIVGFAILFLCFGDNFGPAPITEPSAALYYSVVTFTTLGYGDITPNSTASLGRFIVMGELVYFVAFLAMKLPLAVAITRVRGGGGLSTTERVLR